MLELLASKVIHTLQEKFKVSLFKKKNFFSVKYHLDIFVYMLKMSNEQTKIIYFPNTIVLYFHRQIFGNKVYPISTKIQIY